MSTLNFELDLQSSQGDSSIYFTNFILFSGEILLYVKSKMPTLSLSLLISFFLSLLLFLFNFVFLNLTISNILILFNIQINPSLIIRYYSLYTLQKINMYSFLHFWPHPGFCKFQKQLHAIDPYSNHNCFLLFSHFIACSLGSCIRHCFQFQLNFFLISLWSPIPNGEEPSWFILALTNLGCHFQFAYLNIYVFKRCQNQYFLQGQAYVP